LFETVVVGVDGRKGGGDALRLGHQLAQAGGGALIAVRVFPYQYRPAVKGAPAVEEQRRSTEAALDRELSDAGLHSARARVVGDTSPARALHSVVDRERADLLVVGSTHRGRIGRVLAGDVALATLAGSPCPVAVAPSGFAGMNEAPLRAIGVGFDGAPESQHALALASALAKRTGARLELLCAVPPPGAVFTGAAYEDGGIVDYRMDAQDVISRTVAGLDADASGEAVIGNSVEWLAELGERVDLLVVGSRGRGPLRRTLLGSTSAKLIRKAACPVLVMPRGAATREVREHGPAASTVGATS
jgi:nucleotide-binding universal stress UspA family protein